ncbi:hypothetical protein ACTS9C_02565 [Empedobacter brevis]
MLSQNLIDFYNSWTQKANQIIDNNLSNVYDKYITLFITFNNLYNQIPQELVKRDVVMPAKIYDKKAATDYVVTYLGATNILNEFSNSDNDKDITSLIDIIDQELFYIKLKHGQRQRQEDLKILANLRSHNNVDKATAILQVAYYVRCNMFHGHKGFVEYQRLLVEPLINIMTTVNRSIFTELNK